VVSSIAGLIDSIDIAIMPVVLGKGTKLGSCGLSELSYDLRELVEDLAETCGCAIPLFLGGGGVVAREGQFGRAYRRRKFTASLAGRVIRR